VRSSSIGLKITPRQERFAVELIGRAQSGDADTPEQQRQCHLDPPEF
jgi:hypothetical protein